MRYLGNGIGHTLAPPPSSDDVFGESIPEEGDGTDDRDATFSQLQNIGSSSSVSSEGEESDINEDGDSDVNEDGGSDVNEDEQAEFTDDDLVLEMDGLSYDNETKEIHMDNDLSHL